MRPRRSGARREPELVVKPTRPIRRGYGPAGPIRARYKARNADFCVEELPAYEPTGAGDHTYLLIEKDGVTTMDAVARLAEALGRRQKDFGYAGLKDARAVARQWVSIEHVREGELAALELEGVRIVRTARHSNKLKLGHLRGNRFTILLRGAAAREAETARLVLGDLARRGVPNYFGEQRFGKRGANLEKGLRILGGNPRRAARTMPRRLLNLVVSAVQSEVFNRVLVDRLDSLDVLEAGDVAWLHRNGACFVVADAAAEQQRFDAFELSPSGPLPGPKMLLAQGAQAAREARALAAVGLDLEIFGRMPYGTHEGARRPLRAPVGEPAATAVADGVLVSFALPRGSYATAVLRELLVDVPWFGG